MLIRRAVACIATALLASTCARSGDASSSFSGGPAPDSGAAASSGSDSGPGNQDSGGSSSGASGTGNASSSDDSATSMPAMSTGTFDVGVQPDFDPGPVGCQGKIDFLFVIESWYAMKSSQDKLQAAFKTFTDMIGQEFAEFDYHIMVVDASGMPLMPSKCDSCYSCIGCTMPGCGDFGGPLDYPCDYVPSACDVTEGAGTVVTGNFDATNHPCALFGGNRYIIKGEPDLEGTFKCIATLGQGPKTPTAAMNMMAALAPDMLDGGCNDGFLRDEALLAVIELTAASDGLSPGTPQSWYDALVAAKHGNEEAVVLLAFSHDLDDSNQLCLGDSNQRAPQRDFVETAAHGIWESVCVDSYIPALEKTAEVILEQCTVFVPQ
ncbi:MAG: hypothetical protein JNL82_40440 [Myxococcales bacterium]|nr:hypothetical protein [Myxococcales bacterium]